MSDSSHRPVRPVRRSAGLSAGLVGRPGSASPEPVPARKLVAPLPPSVLSRLMELGEEEVFPSALDVVNQLHGGWGCAVFRVEEAVALPSEVESEAREGTPREPVAELAVPGLPLRERFLHAAPDLLLQCCDPAARDAILRREPLVMESKLSGQRCLVAALPVIEEGEVEAVICRVQDLGQRGEAAALAAMQESGLLRRVATLRGEHRRLRSRFGRVAAFVELLGAAEGGVDFQECARKLANHLREMLECETVALAVSSWGGPRLAAVSGETGPGETHTPGRRALLSHLGEAVSRNCTLVHRRSGTTASPSPLREWFDPAVSLCLPLCDVAGRTRGAWLFLWKEEPPDFEEKRALLRAASPEVAPLLTLLKRAKPGKLAGPFVRFWKEGTRLRRKAIAAFGAAVLIGAFVPLPYPVRATCELQPVVRRVIAAPFDGILKHSVARAGELVRKGQLLAEMDGRELRSQLAEAVADRERAEKESDFALSEGRVADARIAALAAEGLGHRIDLLEYRIGHLEVRSPIDGVVLKGDLERAEGAPLRVGDSLFEVGPLERLVAEIAIPAGDISLVEPGAAVKLKLESDTLATVGSRILRIAPKSEWRDDRNVFICEAEVENGRETLRAGLKGKAKVSGPHRPLAWIWAREAWLALRYHLW